jgi:hypothetical protein
MRNKGSRTNVVLYALRGGQLDAGIVSAKLTI